MNSRGMISFFRILLAAALTLTSYLATTSLAVPVVEDLNDKVSHILAFLTLALLVDQSWPAASFWAGKAPALLAYGLAIEIVQYFLPYRTFSLFDLAADGTGLLCYWILLRLLSRLRLPGSRRSSGASGANRAEP